jgi:pimeloyl-ACP methyl ester carboxylesterase
VSADEIVEHHETAVSGLKWHWVEAGEGPTVVLLHGIPESWYCWHNQIPALAEQFRVLAVDMKGYGRSDKDDGDYSAGTVAKETLDLLDYLDVDRFRIAGHDWGTMVADRICESAPERVIQYVRASISVHRYDVRNSLQHIRYHLNPEESGLLMSNARAYVRVWFESSCAPQTLPPAEELERIAAEFAYPDTGKAVVRYFRDVNKTRPTDFSKLTMPVLSVHGERDPRQPLEYVRGIEDHIPGLEAVLLLDCGHFVTTECPREMSQAMVWFFNGMLASGVPLFDRSRAHGFPTRPVRPVELDNWAFPGSSA